MANTNNKQVDFILFNEEYKIFICTLHGYAITQVGRHLRLEHEELKLPERKQIIQAHQHQEAVLWTAVRTPPSHSTPIRGLHPPTTALRCQATSCSFISTHIESIKRHARQEHQWRSSQQATFWSYVSTQTWFTTGGRRKYFEVRVPDGPAASTHAYGASAVYTAQESSSHSIPRSASRVEPTGARLPSRQVEAQLKGLLADAEAMDQEQQVKMQEMDKDMLKQDRTGWYSRTQWVQHFQGRNLKFLAHATRLPDRDEGFLSEVIRVFNLFASQAAGGIDTLDHELRRWLRSEQATTISPRPFGRLQNLESEDRYWGYLRRFVCYVFRVWHTGQPVQNSTSVEEEEINRHSSRPAVATGDTCNYSSSDNNDLYNDHHDSSSDGDDDLNRFGTPSTQTENEDRTIPTGEIDIMKDARELFPWDDNQRDWAGKCCDYIPPNNGVSDETRIKAIQGLLTSFIFQHIGGERFQSGLVHFTAVLGIDEENRRLRPAVDFSYMIAGLVWDIRVLGVEILFPAQERAEQLREPALRQRFLRQRAQYLADGTGTPTSELINLLAYGKHVALNTSNAGSIIWSKDKQTMFFHGLAITMTSFRAMVLQNIEHAEALLWEKLMWIRDRAERFTIDLNAIEDDLTFTRRGMSFLTRERNGLQGGREYMMTRMLRLKGQRSLQRRDGQWKLRKVRKYLADSVFFLERLLFAMHSTYGQVGRGSEVLSIRFRNGALQDRNIYAADGSVFIVTRYHKSQALFDTPKVIPRFLPWRVGQLMMIYLVYVQPFREYLLKRTQKQDISDHIWHSESGPWETERLTRIIKRETAIGLGHRLNTLNFRHIVISIGRVVVDPKFSAGYKDDIGEVKEPEQEGEDGLELQSGRGEAIGSSRYGVRSDIVKHLTVRSIETFRPLSEGWHRFLGLASDSRDLHDVHSRLSSSTGMATPTQERTKRPVRDSWEVSRHPPQWRRRFHPNEGPDTAIPSDAISIPDAHAIVEGLHRLFGDGPVQFHSREQEEGVLAVLRGESPVTIVLPTGGGKTLLAMLPVVLEDDGVTIFVAPFRALIDNVVARFQEARLDCFEWKVGETNPARIVVVSADMIARDGFITWARTLAEHGLLRRIFIDECHTTFTDGHWRKNLDGVRRVRELPCPIYLLTATLPPQRVSELEHSMAVSTTRVIRASTIRPRHRYYVQRCRAGAMMDEAVDMCRRRQRHLVARQQKGVVYSKSVAQCEELAQALGCLHYHSRVAEREERLRQWLQEGGMIVATSALGTGIDIAGIVFVLHVDIPWSVIDFAQESGRGGRAGERVDSMILVAQDEAERRLQERGGELGVEMGTMLRYIISGGCRRRVLSEYLDGPTLAGGCRDDPEWARCDRCGEGEHEIRQRTRQEEEERRQTEEAMGEMTIGCVYCWLDGEEGVGPHSTQRCDRGWWGEPAVEGFRGQIRYRGETHSCHRCGISQALCATRREGVARCLGPSSLMEVRRTSANFASHPP